MNNAHLEAVGRHALTGLMALLVTSACSAAEPAPAATPASIKAFDCAQPCKVTLYDADGQKLREVDAPNVGPNGMPFVAHGKGFLRIELEGQAVYVRRMDVRLNKGLVATNPGGVTCTPQTGTMGSGC